MDFLSLLLSNFLVNKQWKYLNIRPNSLLSKSLYPNHPKQRLNDVKDTKFAGWLLETSDKRPLFLSNNGGCARLTKKATSAT